MLNSLLLFTLKTLSLPVHWRFGCALRNAEKTQASVLQNIIREMAKTQYGQDHGLLATDDYQTFTKKIPLISYENIESYIEKQKATKQAIIAPTTLACFEKTSGSSGASKYIPYTNSLKSSFARMFLIWAHDVLYYGPKLKTGKIFMSISPAFRDESKTSSGVAVGLESDSDYVDGFTRFFLDRFLVQPKNLKQIQDPTEYRKALSLSLLSAQDLEIISIWNPNYLESLMTFISVNRAEFAKSVSNPEITKELNKPQSENINWKLIWPELKILSCWTEGSAETFSIRLQGLLNGVYTQGKGLLSTEAAMTLPLIQASGSIPFLTDVFFEFIDADQNIHLVHNLKQGQEYSIVITQNSGLLRYKMGDRVLVTGFYNEAPLLKFLGRDSLVSDLVGEKLNIQYVEQSLSTIQGVANESFVFSDIHENPPCYRLVIAEHQSAQVAESLEAEFMKTTHYRLARLLGQLGPVKATKSSSPEKAYYSSYEKLGLKWGDIKFQKLITRRDFAAIFNEEPS